MNYNASPLERLIGAICKAARYLPQGRDTPCLSGAEHGQKRGAGFCACHRGRAHQNPSPHGVSGFTEDAVCSICANDARDASVICVVETPRDVSAFERTREFKGRYHVLYGLISPMDGITAEQLTVKELLARLQDGTIHGWDYGHQSYRRGRGHGDVSCKACKAAWRARHAPCLWLAGWQQF